MQVLAQKISKMESKIDYNSKVGLTPKSTIQHFWSAEWHTFGSQPEGIGIRLKHILFDFLAIRTCPSSNLLGSINRDWISKLSILFHALRFPLFLTPLSSIFSLTLKRFWRLVLIIFFL